jgi:hypothetical protein
MSRASPHFAYDDQTRVNSQAHGQSDPMLVPEARIQAPHRFDDSQPGAHRSLGIVFVCPRIAKIDHKPITQILRDMPVKAVDYLCADRMIGTHDLAQLFGVEACRERSRAD